jgi:hypothetical protein
MKQSIAVLAVTAALLVEATPAVQAGPPKAAKKFMPASWELTSSQTPMGRSCNSVTHTETGYNLTHTAMIALSQTVNYCWKHKPKNGHYRITEVRFMHSVWTLWWTPWTFEGLTARTRWGMVGDFEVGRYIQAKFRMCILWYCVSRHPWLEQRVYGIGLYYGDGGLG